MALLDNHHSVITAGKRPKKATGGWAAGVNAVRRGQRQQWPAGGAFCAEHWRADKYRVMMGGNRSMPGPHRTRPCPCHSPTVQVSPRQPVRACLAAFPSFDTPASVNQYDLNPPLCQRNLPRPCPCFPSTPLPALPRSLLPLSSRRVASTAARVPGRSRSVSSPPVQLHVRLQRSVSCSFDATRSIRPKTSSTPRHAFPARTTDNAPKTRAL